jgi:hypothetical protein
LHRPSGRDRAMGYQPRFDSTPRRAVTCRGNHVFDPVQQDRGRTTRSRIVDHAGETAVDEAPAPFVDRIGGYPQVCRDLLVWSSPAPRSPTGSATSTPTIMGLSLAVTIESGCSRPSLVNTNSAFGCPIQAIPQTVKARTLAQGLGYVLNNPIVRSADSRGANVNAASSATTVHRDRDF